MHRFPFLSFFVVFFLSPAFLANASEIEFSPPGILKCASADTCSQNSERFSEFIISFYNWYNQSGRQLYPSHSEGTTEKRLERNKLLSTFLSPKFMHRLTNLAENPEDNDYDPVLCAQDFYDEQHFTPAVKILVSDSESVHLEVHFPFSGKSNEKWNRVSLRLVQGKWLINEIICMPSQG